VQQTGEDTPRGIEKRGDLTIWSPPPGDRPANLHLLVTTRHGGVSVPPWDSLNMSTATGDDHEAVEVNRERLQRVAQVPAWQWLHQVHGTKMVDAANMASIPGGTLQADGLWTQQRGVALVIGIADCVPVFLWDRQGERLAVLHAGWRGTEQAIAQRGIECLQQAGSRIEDLSMALGPSIGPCCYAVSEDVLRRLPVEAQQQRADGNFADLRAANRHQALQLGITADRIAADPPCTACNTQHFFSHRRQGPATGRMWAVAWLDAS
jgi:YfiH family protein